jgi:DNA polymerase-4
VAAFDEHIAHVDMDAFFVEVERLGHPDLRRVAVVVGGLGSRGVVSSASYEARKCGVTSGMPIVQARRLCPKGRFLAPDHHAYRAASEAVFTVFRSFSPVVEPVSVDEAFIDIAGLRLAFDSPQSVAQAVKVAVRRGTGLPCSVGVASSKLIAKLASRAAKPDGLLVVPAGTERAFLDPMPVRALWGVGEATYARLEELGVRTVGDLAAYPRETLEGRLGEALGGYLWDLANARDDRPVEPGGSVKSLSVEETFEADISGAPALEVELLRQADRLGSRLRREGLLTGSVHLKVRFGDFSTITRSVTLPGPVDTSHDLYQTAILLLKRAAVGGRPVRLLGLGAGTLVQGSRPLQLGLEQRPWGDVESAVDRIRERFGASAVNRARLAPMSEREGGTFQNKAGTSPGQP